MNNIKLIELSELVDIFNNVRVPLSSKQRENLDKIYPYYGAQGIVDYVDDYLFEGEYILIAEDGENLRSNYQNICNLVNGKFWVNNHAHIVKANAENNTKYLYYNFNRIKFEPYVTGSSQPKLNKENLLNIKAYVHESINDQKSIAKVLSDLDAKIELNKKINRELEAMAKTLYDYWFVQFDFPNADGKPYKSSGGKMVYNAELKREIPEGWAAGTLNDAISKTGTGLNPRDNFVLGEGDNYYVTIKSIEQGRVVLDDKCDKISDETLEIINKRSDLHIGDILFTSIEPVGLTYLIQEIPKNWNINESVFTIRPNYKKVTSEFLFMFLSGDYIKAYTKNVAAGSIHKGVRHSTLKECKFIMPAKNTIMDFTLLIKPIFKKQDLLQKQTQHLTALRDWLLPMLMNGQVTVGQAHGKQEADERLNMAAEPSVKYGN